MTLLGNSRGIALLVTLAVISVLLVLALELARVTGRSVMVTAENTDRFQAREQAMAGIHLAMAILAEDAGKNQVDSVQEAWADPHKLANAVTRLGYPRDSLTLSIVDELGKIQANALLRQFPGHELNPDQLTLWEHLLALKIDADKSEDQRDPAAILNAVKDWLDSGDNGAQSGLSGAESDYYLGLELPYPCANGPFNQVDEMLNVKGMTQDLILSDQGTPLFTVHGLDDLAPSPQTFRFSGRVNINTASAAVLTLLLPRGMEAQAQELVNFRKETSEDGETFINALDKGWYKKVIELSKNETIVFERIIRYDSHCFRAVCTARVHQAQVKVQAIIKREQDKKSRQWRCRIIQLTRE